MFRTHFYIISVLICANVNASNNLTSLKDNLINQWEPKIFSGQTIYDIEEINRRVALKAISDGTASGLVLSQTVDLIKTPYLNWSWLIKRKLFDLDERSKDGDDFVARIYLVKDGGLFVWKTKSLNYVWSSNQAQNLIWDNPYAGERVKMISIKGKEASKNQWYEEKRNVFLDLINTFGDKGSKEANHKAYRYIDVIAIMTDTDNSGKYAESYYGDIIFTDK